MDRMNETPLLEAVGISKIYSQGAVAVGLHRLSCKLYAGEFVAVTGSSGSGKSTLLNLLSGLDSYDEGELLYRGERTSHFDEADREKWRNKNVAFIFQAYNVLDSYTVYQNIELVLLDKLPDKKQRRERVMELIRAVGLEEHANHRTIKLSGGQKQRVAIARALAMDAPILFADEPCGNLDSKTTKEILELLYSVSRGKLVIVVTHSFEELEPYATRKLRLADGQLVEDQLLHEPAASQEEQVQEPAPTSRKQKLATLARVAWYNTKATPRKSMFGIVGLVILTVLFVWGMTLAVDSMRPKPFTDAMFEVYFDDDLQVFDKTGGKLGAEQKQKLLAIPGVCAVVDGSSSVSAAYNVDDYGYTAYVRPASCCDAALLEGRMPQNAHEIVLSVPPKRKYTSLPLVGTTVNIDLYVWTGDAPIGDNADLTVCGVTVGEEIVYVSDTDYMDMLSYETYSDAVTVVCKDGELDKVRDTLRSQGLGVFHLYGDELDTGFQALTGFAVCFALMIAVSLCYRVLGGSYRALEKTKRVDYNTMRSIGLKSEFVKKVYYAEMVLQSLIGWVVGVAISLLILVVYGVCVTPKIGYGFAMLSTNARDMLWVIWVALVVDLVATVSNAVRFNKYFYKQTVKYNARNEVTAHD